jgi:squalene synthase HpnC
MRSSRPIGGRSAEANEEVVRSDDEAVRMAAPAPEQLRRQARAENFPVALRVLPARYRVRLGHLYDVARVIDDLGDTGEPEHRTAALLAFRDDLSTLCRGGTPRSPVLRNLASTIRESAGPAQDSGELASRTYKNCLDLIEANLRDQTKTVYLTYDELLDYCRFSANPVGRLVLDVFGAATPKRVALSDKVCTALQIIEHCQDVAEDHRAGRLYLPRSDLDRFGVRRSDLEAPTASPEVRRLIRFQAERAETLLAEGATLIGHLRGWARVAVAGYVAGGRAAVEALRRGDWAVLPTHPPRRRRDVLAALVGLWVRSGPRPRRPHGQRSTV